MSVVGLSQVSSAGGQVDSSNSKNNVMGKDDFLTLLVAQLQAQDPLNPMDSTGFTAQLAQFSSLEQLQNINANLGDIGTSQSVLTNSQAVGFIGKTITAVGNGATVADGVSSPLQIQVDDDAAGMYVNIYDQQGNFVRDLDVGPLEAGPHSLSWDARDYLGGTVPDGMYHFEVSAIDSEGNSLDTTEFTSGTVSGVNFKDGLAYLVAGEQEIPLGNVVSVITEDNP